LSGIWWVETIDVQLCVRRGFWSRGGASVCGITDRRPKKILQ